jgi:hypothetical protein
VTAAAVLAVVWHHFARRDDPDPPGLGASIPPLKLLDAATSEPLILLGLRGKVVWITFWSANSPEGAADLAALEPVWNRLSQHAKFTMAAVAARPDRPEIIRAAISASRSSVPVYLATPETLRAFGARRSPLPLHVLLDPTGRIAAVSQGRDPAIIARLADRASGWLAEIAPTGKTRFTSRPRRSKLSGPVADSAISSVSSTPTSPLGVAAPIALDGLEESQPLARLSGAF